MSQREIITLQFGTQSNFVGSHFWNLQNPNADYQVTKPATRGVQTIPGATTSKIGQSNAENIDECVLFRSGSTENGVNTKSPRLLLFDIKDNLGPLRQDGYQYYQSIYRNPYEECIQPVWKGAVECFNSSSVQSEVSSEPLGTYWSDYLRCPLHPKTVYPVHTMGGSFDAFGEGSVIYNESGKVQAQEALDAVRYFLEECDSPQGFQCSVDMNSGFSGYATQMMTELRDAYVRFQN